MIWPTTKRAGLALMASVLGAAAVAVPARSATAAEEQLALRYAPVVRLVEQPEECGPGEPYRPIDIDAILGEDTVSLRGPWQANDLVQIAPTAAVLGRGLYEYNLDFPGDALNPGCSYERWARRVTEGTQPTVYAHVATEAARPGKLALQYWLYYPFNDWNNTHEGDWEMIQLVFDASTPAQALERRPREVGYSQHEGAERASWGDEKLDLVGGTHPVVYPAAGSHANFYDAALFLGRSGSEGVGCDDTTGPHLDLRPDVRTIPADPRAATGAYPWIAFEGRWGERHQAFFDGPTGPNLKTQWTKPISWSEGWRARSHAIPGGGALGTGATDFFCGAVETGSNVVRRLVSTPLLVIGMLVLLVALVAWLVSRTSWRPTATLRLARRRSWGQTVSTSWRMFLGRPLLFTGIGLVTIPISIILSLLQAGIFAVAGLGDSGEGAGIRFEIALAIGAIFSLLGLALVQAASARAMAEIDAGRPVRPVGAYRLVLDSIKPLLGAIAVAVPVVTLLTFSVLLLPIAVLLAVRWALLVPCIELAVDRPPGALGALRCSGSLVRRQWLKVLSLVVGTTVLVLLLGPVIGGLLLLATGMPYAVINIVAGLVYAVAMPLVGITTTYVYYDALTRERLAEPPVDMLPAEIDVATSPG